MGVLTHLSACSCSSPAMLIIYLTIHNEGVYISFPSCALKLSNLEFNSIYFTFTSINAFYLLKMRAKWLKVRLHYTSAPSFNYHIYVRRINFKVISKFTLALVQLSFASALARLMLAMLLHHTPSLENFHGLLSMSLRMACPCFWIFALFSQLESSTGWSFHLTKYSKYSFLLVLLLTLLLSMHSICGFSATGICFVH
jgi:hypothetical protein